MKNKAVVLLALLLCLSLAASAASALSIGSGRGEIRRGVYYNGNVSFPLPSTAWTEVSALAYSDYDEIELAGPTDVNGFYPCLDVRIHDTPWDMEGEFGEMSFNNSDYVRVANQTFSVGDAGLLAHYDCYLDSLDNGRMEFDYQIRFNCGDYGVSLYYYTFSSTRSIPDDLPALDGIVTAFSIDQ